MARYSLDTSAILDAWVRFYPIDLFPSFWSKFSELAVAKTTCATILVQKELSKKDDGCCKWFKTNGINTFFEEISDDVQFATIELLKNVNFQRLIEERKGNFGADPFVVAHAQVNGLILVTGEKRTHSSMKPKIPDVCDQLNVRTMDIQQLMRAERWRF